MSCGTVIRLELRVSVLYFGWLEVLNVLCILNQIAEENGESFNF